MGSADVDSVDVLVAGGGPAGAAAAAGAHAEGLEVALVDAGGSRRPGESLPPGGAAVIDEVFGTRGFCESHFRPALGNRSAWGSDRLESAEFMLNPLGHGWHLDREELAGRLLERVHEAGVEVLGDTRVVAAMRDAGRWNVALEGSARRLTAGAVIDATGRASRVARAHGGRRRRLDRLVAAYWLLEEPGPMAEDATTLVEAVADGWWYTTPLPHGRRAAAFLTDSDLLRPGPQRTVADWNLRLTRAPNIRDAVVRLRGAPRIYDASVSHLERLAGEGWVATGDAAASFDPLSSQGIVTALLMGREAGRAIATMLLEGRPEPLVRYGARYAELLTEHCSLRTAYYGLERRWPEEPFWARRRVEPGGGGE